MFCSLILTGFKRALLDSDLWALEEGSLSHSIVPRLQSEWEKEIRKCHGSVNNVCKNNFYYYNFYYKIRNTNTVLDSLDRNGEEAQRDHGAYKLRSSLTDIILFAKME